MDRVLKVFSARADQRAIVENYRVIEPYDAFVLVEATPREAARLTRRFPVEDITDLYSIQLEGRELDSSAGRSSRGAARSAARPKPLAPGPHHYLVQFVGPIKRQWLTAVGKA